jgi:hypothetical protein
MFRAHGTPATPACLGCTHETPDTNDNPAPAWWLLVWHLSSCFHRHLPAAVPAAASLPPAGLGRHPHAHPRRVRGGFPCEKRTSLSHHTHYSHNICTGFIFTFFFFAVLGVKQYSVVPSHMCNPFIHAHAIETAPTKARARAQRRYTLTPKYRSLSLCTCLYSHSPPHPLRLCSPMCLLTWWVRTHPPECPRP